MMGDETTSSMKNELLFWLL